jgi:hypothetical protein
MKLEVHSVRSEDFLQDLVRVHTSHRKGIRAGQLCKVTANGKSIIAVARHTGNRKAIFLDSTYRKVLQVRSGEEVDFRFDKISWFQEFIWVWRASDPVNRTAGRLGIVSLALGIVGIILGIWSVYLAFKPPI